MNFAGVSWYSPGGHALDRESQWASHRHDLAWTFRPVPRRSVDRSHRPALSRSAARSHARFFVLATAYIAWRGHLQLWHLYAMTLITGTGSAMYWATVNALVQEVIPPSQFTGANAAVLVACKAGMLTPERSWVSLQHRWNRGDSSHRWRDLFRVCLLPVPCARGYVSPRDSQNIRGSITRRLKRPPRHWKREKIRRSRSGPLARRLRGHEGGVRLSKQQPLVLALGITHSIMMAGVVSANVVLVALANDILRPVRRDWAFWRRAGPPARLSED